MTSSSDLPVYAGGPVQSGGDRGHRGDRATGLPFYRATGLPIPFYRFRATDSEEKKMTSSSDLPVYAGDPVQSGGDRGHRGDRAPVLPFYRATGLPIPGPPIPGRPILRKKYSDPKPTRSRLQRSGTQR